MKILKKLTSVFLSCIFAFSCLATLSIHSSATSILAVTVLTKPTKLVYYQGTDWDYGYYDFPEDDGIGTFVYTKDATFTYQNKTYSKISFFHSGGFYTDQYPDRGMLDLTGLSILVLYSDDTTQTITYKETKEHGDTIHQNIYANPALGNFFVGTNKINVYVPGNSKIKASFDIQIVESEQYQLGDVTMDKKINSSDALLILQSVVNLKTLTAAQKALADINSDHRINSADALKILQITVGE